MTALAELPNYAIAETPQPEEVAVRKKHKVLIIDDDESLSEVLAYQLKRQGLTARAARTGKVGLEKAKAEQPSAILLDLGLPDIDGLSICEQLADSPETSATPIIILSGRDQAGLVRRCRAAGCHYFVHKPCDPNVLLLLLRQAIRNSMGHRNDEFGED
jgi:DNA-binding response OmpR family regulator